MDISAICLISLLSLKNLLKFENQLLQSKALVAGVSLMP